ncbi:hypothetical protein Tco_1508567 [Tanacetum coccineum]
MGFPVAVSFGPWNSESILDVAMAHSTSGSKVRQRYPISRLIARLWPFKSHSSFVRPLLPYCWAKVGSFSNAAGVCSAYTEKIGCAEGWREMFSGLDDMLVLRTSPSYAGRGSLLRDERSPPEMDLLAFGYILTGRHNGTRAGAPEIESTAVLAPTPLRRMWIKGCKQEGYRLLMMAHEDRLKEGAPSLSRFEYFDEEESRIISIPPRLVDTWLHVPPQEVPKAFDGKPVDQCRGFDRLCAASRARGAAEGMWFANDTQAGVHGKMRICCLLKAQLVDAQGREGRVFEVLLHSTLPRRKWHWLDDFRHKVEGLLEKQEDKLRKLSIEYDEELYPHMLSTIAERRWLISHGLRLAAMSTLESQEVRQSFGDVVKCALARGKAEAVEELHERRLLTVPAAQVPGYNQKAYEELVAAMEAMKLLELPHIAQLERDQDYPIGVIMTGLTLARHATEGAEAQPDYFLKPDVSQLQVPIFASPRDILNPFALEKEVPLKESLEAHAIRLAKKKGVKGKAILCGVGAAHLPRSDGVPVSVATVSPKDSELLGKLEEAGDAAYQVGRPEQSRCHSI